MVVLGIDPGTRRVGYGVVKKDGDGLVFVTAGLLKIKCRGGFGALREIKTQLDDLIGRWRPKVLAIEKLFFMKNRKTGLAVAEARGVILLSAVEYGLEIREYAPNEVKSATTGYGFADKRAVAAMVRLLLKKPGLRLGDDVSDALALAILACRKAGPL